MDEWIKKMWYTDIYKMEYYSAIKKKKILPSVTTWMELEKKKSQTHRNRESRLVVARGWGEKETGRYWSKDTNFQL